MCKFFLINIQPLTELYRFRKSRLNYDLIVELEEKKANRTEEDLLPPSINPQTNALIEKMPVNDDQKNSLKQSVAHIGFRASTWATIFICWIVLKWNILTKEKRQELNKKDMQDYDDLVNFNVPIFSEMSIDKFIKNLKAFNFFGWKNL
ncbi:Oidioi.mRNA.OKI2018_I69.chr1.g1513.t1.cds [Oikopleura dioica]|uniref:Oidioi.mRNA.OKI2018_I69.chr1.g1513.t1.cds n=1 Tax=Oikopleura dioica TaxID=34765 RepID=A0ABN7SSE5_OIKDI|nr:Oidioi.mRNA.OKI2018_I69.chr1.g1513.t1.cds [Oikopleura dioica]